MILLPIPTEPEYLLPLQSHWLPFLQRISQHSREPVETLLAPITRREVQIILAWDDEALQAVALAGVKRWRRGDEIIADIIWATGFDHKTWQHLLPELERYLKDTGCAECRPICRPGWSKLLKQHGYRTTHLQMEKRL